MNNKLQDKKRGRSLGSTLSTIHKQHISKKISEDRILKRCIREFQYIEMK